MTELCKWVQIETDTCVPCENFQVNSHSRPWFSTAMTIAAYVHRHLFFDLDQPERFVL